MKVELIDHMGSDDRVADSARVSFARKASDYTPELNYELVSRILDGRLEYALIHIDDWLVE